MLDTHPLRVGNPLAGEGLQFFDGVARGVGEEGPDQVQAFVVGQVRGGFVREGFPVEVLAVYQMLSLLRSHLLGCMNGLHE